MSASEHMNKHAAVDDFIQETRMLSGDIRRTIGRIHRVEEILDLHGMSYEGGTFKRTANDGSIPAHVIELVDYWNSLQALLRHYRQDEERAVYIIEGIQEPHWRNALSMYALDGYSVSAIGRELNCAHTTASRWVDSAKGQLAGCYSSRNATYLQSRAECSKCTTKNR